MNYYAEWSGNEIIVYTDDENYKAELEVYIYGDLDIEGYKIYVWDIPTQEYVRIPEELEEEYFKELFGEFDPLEWAEEYKKQEELNYRRDKEEMLEFYRRKDEEEMYRATWL